MASIRYKAVCKKCATYCVKDRVEYAIGEIQIGHGEQPMYSPKKCEPGKHDLIIFEMKEDATK